MSLQSIDRDRRRVRSCGCSSEIRWLGKRTYVVTSRCLTLGPHANLVGKRRRPVIGTVVKGRDNAMRAKIQFLQQIAVIGIAALLAAAPTRLSAQPTSQSAIRVGEHDLGDSPGSP